MALFLAGPESSLVTGSSIVADGGRTGLTNGTYGQRSSYLARNLPEP